MICFINCHEHKGVNQLFSFHNKGALREGNVWSFDKQLRGPALDSCNSYILRQPRFGNPIQFQFQVHRKP